MRFLQFLFAEFWYHLNSPYFIGHIQQTLILGTIEAVVFPVFLHLREPFTTGMEWLSERFERRFPNAFRSILEWLGLRPE